MGKILHLYNPQGEIEARELHLAILELAAARDSSSDALVLALADTLASIAVSLDRRDGVRSLNDRMHSFLQRVDSSYRRMHDVAATRDLGEVSRDCAHRDG